MTLIDEILNALEFGEFQIRWFKRKDIDGQCVYRKRTLYISIYADAPVSVLIHEIIHWLYPQWSEDLVLNYEFMCYQNLTAEDRRILSRALVKARHQQRMLRDDNH